MSCIYHILLQVPQSNYTGFVIKAGIIVILLSIFILSQAIYSRKKRNRYIMEKKLLQEQFDSQIMQTKIEIQEATFDILGKELHDNVGQLLSTAKMFIGITERNLEAPPFTLVSANETLDRAIKELRNLSKSLNRDWLQQFNLYNNLVAEINRINSGGQLTILLKRQTHILPAISEHQFLFYRLLQEGIQNVIKHSEAKNLTISISYDRNYIKASLQDDGKGFDVKNQQTGLGIKNMKQRITMLKGRIDWQSSAEGTYVNILFPIKKPLL